MGTCFGNTSVTESFVIQRTASLSTNLTGSCSLDQNSIQKSSVKRTQHQNKKSYIAFFHQNPTLKPLLDNNLYSKRKPCSLNLIRSLEQISEEDIPTQVENRSYSKTQPCIKIKETQKERHRFGPKRLRFSSNKSQKFF